MRSFLAFVLVLSALSCRKAALEPVAVQRLAEHLVAHHRDVFSESLGTEMMWSDRAILERATRFPAPVQAVLDAAKPDGGLAEGAMGRLLQDLERRSGEWRAATVSRSGTDDFACAIGDAAEKADVNCVYVNYLEARYPGARFKVKGPLEAVLFMEGPRVRAALMPVKR